MLTLSPPQIGADGVPPGGLLLSLAALQLAPAPARWLCAAWNALGALRVGSLLGEGVAVEPSALVKGVALVRRALVMGLGGDAGGDDGGADGGERSAGHKTGGQSSAEPARRKQGLGAVADGAARGSAALRAEAVGAVHSLLDQCDLEVLSPVPPHPVLSGHAASLTPY